MSRPIAYNTPALAVNGSITNEDAVISYVVDGRGNDYYNGYADRKWVPSADGAAPIVFVTDTFTRGYEGDPTLAVPLFFACAGTSSAAILYTANRLPGSPGNYTDANTALNDLNRTYGYFILESNDPFQGINATNLVFNVDASKMTSYPQTGTNWYDLSGNGNSGALTNGPTWNSNGWIIFDSTDDFVATSVNTNALFSSNDPFSVSITLKPTETINANSGLVTNQRYQSETSPGGFGLVTYDTNQVAINLTKNDGTGVVSYESIAPTTLTVNSWQNIIYTYNPGTGTVTGYKNGTLVNSSTSANYKWTPEARVTWIARNWQGGWGNFFSSEISNVSIYRKTLSQTEVKQNYFGAPIVTDGLVFAVDANNIVSYPKSGTTLYNLTGSINSGSLINSPTFNPANGGSIVFDGTDDYIDTNFTQTFTDELTVETWYRGTKSTRNHLWNFGTYPASNLNFDLNDSGLSLWVYWQGGGSPAIRYTTPNFTDGNIHHLVFRHSGSVNQVYFDGQLLTPYDVLGTQTFTGGGVGGSYNIGGSPVFGGNIYTNRIYNRALSASEILQNYQAEQYRFETAPGIPTNGLILHLDAANPQSYPGSGTVWYDISGQGANADLVNGVTWNSSGYFFFDGTDDIANSINISQDYRDLVIGIWSESNGGLEMVFSMYGGVDASFRLNANVMFSANNNDDWQFGSNDLVFVDGAYTPQSNLGSQFHFVRTYRSNNVDFGTSFRYSLSSTFLSRYFKGKIAFVLCYNRQLSDAEVRGLYYYYKDRFPF